MKSLLAFLSLAVALAAAPSTPINNLVVQVNGTAQSGVLAGNGAGVAAATATGTQISTALDLIGATRGSLLYRGASAWSPLTPGTSGYVLTSGGAGADPVWAVNAGGDVVGPASSTLNAWPLFADTTGKLLKNSDVTYATPTLSVPDAFVVSSAGSIGLTTSGSLKNITLLSTAGQVIIPSSSTLPTPQSGFGLQVGPFTTFEGIATTPSIQARRTNTSAASPSATLSGNGLLSLGVKGYMTTAYSPNAGTLSFNAIENWTDSANGTSFTIGTTATGGSGGAVSSLIVTGGPAVTLTGGAGNMTITAGTGASRTLALQTTTSGSTATTGLLITATQQTLLGGLTSSGTGVLQFPTATDNTGGLAFSTDTWFYRTAAGAMEIRSTGSNPKIRLNENGTTNGVFETSGGTVFLSSITNNNLVLRTNSTTAITIGTAQQATFSGAIIGTVQALSGAGAINVTQTNTDFTSTGSAQALTLANGTAGQIKTIVHVVDGGSGVLTPTTKVGFSTITFTNAGDSVTLRYTSAGWAVVGSYLATIAP